MKILVHVYMYLQTAYRGLEKREYLLISRDNIMLILHKTYVVTPHLNRLDQMVQMRGHNMQFR